MARKKYDFVIIGSGLTGLLTTYALASNSKKVALLDSGEHLGGNLQKRHTPLGDLPSFMKYFYNQENLNESIERFGAKMFQVEEPVIRTNTTTKTFDSGKFKDFVGFGNRAPEFSEIIQKYTNSENVCFPDSLSELTQRLIQSLEAMDNVELFTDSTLTNFQVEDNRIKLAEINSNKNFEAESFIFTAPVHSLLEIGEENILPVKLKTKIAKPDYWTSIHLEMLHKDANAPTENDYILMGGTNKSIPCYGFFSEEFNNEEAGEAKLQQSQWVSFIESNLTNDMESTGNLVREMKRQVKRAHPEILEKKLFERISVYPFSHGLVDLEIPDFKPGKWENFYLLSKEFDKSNNLLGRIDTAIKFLDSIDLQLAPMDQAISTSEAEEVNSIESNDSEPIELNL